jgi:predicted transcriptional regulator
MSLDILKFVKEHGGSASTLEILQGVQMPLTTIASTLESLKNTNLIEVHPGGVGENVSLTDIGSMVANFSLSQK